MHCECSGSENHGQYEIRKQPESGRAVEQPDHLRLNFLVDRKIALARVFLRYYRREKPPGSLHRPPCHRHIRIIGVNAGARETGDYHIVGWYAGLGYRQTIEGTETPKPRSDSSHGGARGVRHSGGAFEDSARARRDLDRCFCRREWRKWKDRKSVV